MQPRWVQMALSLALLAVLIGAVLAGSIMAAAHARDRYWVNIASGSWVALAWTANHGELYPPLRDDAGNFAGTRYMPLFVLLHAGAARLTGEYLLSGRIITYASAVAWMLAIIVLALQRRASPLFAGALAGSVLLSPVGFQALCTIRSDGLALALQLWALWIVGRKDRAPTVWVAVIAAALCALGFLAKLTAVWAALAIACWLLWHNRRALGAFVATGVLIAGAGVLLMHAATDGRFIDNLQHAGGSGWQGWGAVLLWSPQRLLQFLVAWSPTTWALAAAATLAVVLSLARRDVHLVHIAWVICCGTLAVMYADIGVGENHIIEVAAMTAILVGDLWARAATDGARSNIGDANSPALSAIVDQSSAAPWSVTQMLLAAMVFWCTQATVKQSLWNDLHGAATALRSGQAAAGDDPKLFDQVLAGRTFLSDDPAISVLLDRKPLVSDAFIFRGFAESHPEWTAELVDRIARREFEVIVLTAPADPDSWWYRELFFGPAVVSAIVEHYRFDRRIGAWHLYVRKPA
jgi:hypothetical protein